MANGVAGPIETRRLAVPEAEHAIDGGAGEQANLLAAPDRGGRELLVDAGLKMHLLRLEGRPLLPERLIEAAEGRAPIAGNEATRVQSCTLILPLLLEEKRFSGNFLFDGDEMLGYTLSEE